MASHWKICCLQPSLDRLNAVPSTGHATRKWTPGAPLWGRMACCGPPGRQPVTGLLRQKAHFQHLVTPTEPAEIAAHLRLRTANPATAARRSARHKASEKPTAPPDSGGFRLERAGGMVVEAGRRRRKPGRGRHRPARKHSPMPALPGGLGAYRDASSCSVSRWPASLPCTQSR